jgi:aminopeptidase N
LLLLDALPTELAKAVGGSVIAHELAHQWFGNLITCQWWNSTYINEGFANWLQNAGLRAAAPKVGAVSLHHA